MVRVPCSVFRVSCFVSGVYAESRSLCRITSALPVAKPWHPAGSRACLPSPNVGRGAGGEGRSPAEPDASIAAPRALWYTRRVATGG